MSRDFHGSLLGLVAALAVVGCGDTGDSPAGGASAGGGGDGATGGSSAEAGGGGSGGAFDADAITLLTWNLEQFPKSGETVTTVAAILDELRPDVVALQEIGSEADWQTLNGVLADYEGLLATSGDGFVRVGLLARPDRVIVSDPQTLFQSDDYAFPRAMLSARVASASDPSRDFLIGVVHLKAQLDQESADRRRDACIKLDAWVKEQQELSVDEEIVIAGDFNDELTDPVSWNVFGPLLTATDGGFLTLEPEQAGGYTYIPFTSFIDHVHVRGGALLQNSSAQALPLEQDVSGYVSTVSDHRPVLARLRFEP